MALFDRLDSLANCVERLFQCSHPVGRAREALIGQFLQCMQCLQQRLPHVSPYRCTQAPLTLLHLGCWWSDLLLLLVLLRLLWLCHRVLRRQRQRLLQPARSLLHALHQRIQLLALKGLKLIFLVFGSVRMLSLLLELLNMLGSGFGRLPTWALIPLPHHSTTLST